MKYIFIGVIIAAGVVIFSRCKNSAAAQKTEAKECKPVLIDRDLFSKAVGRMKDNGDVTVENPVIEGDCLTMTVTSAYCKNELEAYELVWNEVTKRSMPPQISLALYADNAERCDKEKTFTLKFDLTPLKTVNPNGSVFMTITGYEGKLEYKSAE